MSEWPKWVWPVLVMGSLVDIFQFVWLTKRAYRKGKRMLYNKLKRELREEEQGNG